MSTATQLPLATQQDKVHQQSLRQGLIALCITEITSWGVLYYAFPVLLGAITRDTGWSTPAVMGAFSIGLAVSALAGIPVGRLLDRYGPRLVMTTGSIIAVLSLAGIVLAPNQWWFMGAWTISGVAQACVFYKPAFAALTRWYGPQRVKALTVLTLVAGLASTIFAPLTATLADHLSWRETYMVLGGLLAVITIPAHALYLTAPWHPTTQEAHTAVKAPHINIRAIIRTPVFFALVTAMTLGTFGLFAATVNLVPMLTEQGASTSFAAWALGLCGAGQLIGRYGYSHLAARVDARSRAVVVLIAASITVALTAVTAGPTATLIVAAILFGAARGVFTLLEATAVSDRWGTNGFGTLYGAYSAPSTVAMAATPWAGALLAAWLGGYQALFIALACILIVAAITAIGTLTPRGQTSH